MTGEIKFGQHTLKKITNSWEGSALRYITRHDGKWIIRIAKGKSYQVHKTIFDKGDKNKALIEAQIFVTKAVKQLPKKIQLQLRNGSPRFRENMGICTTVRRETIVLKAKCNNKYNNTTRQRSLSVGSLRTYDEAMGILKKWLKVEKQKVIKMGIELGLTKYGE